MVDKNKAIEIIRNHESLDEEIVSDLELEKLLEIKNILVNSYPYSNKTSLLESVEEELLTREKENNSLSPSEIAPKWDKKTFTI